MSLREDLAVASDAEVLRRMHDLADPAIVALAYEVSRRRLREAVPDLVALLDAEDGTVQQAALEALGEIGDGSAGASVIRLLEREGLSTQIRDTGAWVLGSLRHVEAIPFLIRTLDDAEPTVRTCAAAALVAVGAEAAVPALMLRLAHEPLDVVRGDLSAALHALGGRGRDESRWTASARSAGASIAKQAPNKSLLVETDFHVNRFLRDAS